MATPFLLLLFLPQDAIQINIVLSLIISIALIWKMRADVDKIADGIWEYYWGAVWDYYLYDDGYYNI